MSAGRPRLLSSIDIGKAKAMRASGYSLSRIGRLLDVSKQTVLRRLTVPYKQRERA